MLRGLGSRIQPCGTRLAKTAGAGARSGRAVRAEWSRPAGRFRQPESVTACHHRHRATALRPTLGDVPISQIDRTLSTYDEDRHSEKARGTHDTHLVRETAVRPPSAEDLRQSPSQDISQTVADLQEEGAVEGEGVEQERLDSEDGGHIDEPFDPTEIKIVTKGPTVDLVMKRIREDEIDLQPDFQRSGDIWPSPTQSRLIGITSPPDSASGVLHGCG